MVPKVGVLLVALNGVDEPNENVGGFCRPLDVELDTNRFELGALLFADHTLSFCMVLLNKLGADPDKAFPGCMLLTPDNGFTDIPLVPPRLPPFPSVKVFDDSEFPAIEPSELPAIEPSEVPAIAFPVSPLAPLNPLLPPKELVGKLLLELNEVPAGRLKVLVLALLLSGAPKGDLNIAGGSVFGVEVLPNVNANFGFSEVAGNVNVAAGAGLLAALFPKLNIGAAAALLLAVVALVWNSGAGLAVRSGGWNNDVVPVLLSGALNSDKVGALVVGRVLVCDCCVNKFTEVLELAGASNNLVFDDTPNENVGFGFSADDVSDKSTELSGVSFASVARLVLSEVPDVNVLF